MYYMKLYIIFWDQPINFVPSVSFCFLPVFGFSGNRYQTKFKYPETF